jgi:phosphoglycolate phosphatase-like HAD superfamily hydrolase
MRFFHPECILTEDNTTSKSKADALLLAVKRLHAETIETLYVGDQPGDWMAAKAARTNFLGVSYGWGISEEDKEFAVVRNVMSIAEYILNEFSPAKRPSPTVA